MNKKYKYHTLIEAFDPQCQSCPPANATEKHAQAYRWVRNPLTADCLRPHGVLRRGRLERTQGTGAKCKLLGLSLHRSLQESVAAYTALSHTVTMMAEIFGDHIAEGKLAPSHGKATPPDDRGHFDLYEYGEVDLRSVFRVIQKV